MFRKMTIKQIYKQYQNKKTMDNSEKLSLFRKGNSNGIGLTDVPNNQFRHMHFFNNILTIFNDIKNNNVSGNNNITVQELLNMHNLQNSIPPEMLKQLTPLLNENLFGAGGRQAKGCLICLGCLYCGPIILIDAIVLVGLLYFAPGAGSASTR